MPVPSMIPMLRSAVLLTAVALVWSCACAQAETVDSDKAAKVKAGYLYNFAKFTNWPDSAFSNSSSPLVFGVVGDEAVGKILLKSLKNKIEKDRRIEVRLLSKLDEKNVRAYRTCHILFIGEDEKNSFDKILKSTSGHPVMTVSDSKDFAKQGGVVELFLKSTKIAMRVNTDSAESARLRISSKLLRLAEIVKKE